MGFMEQLLEYIPPHPLKYTVHAYPGKNMVIFNRTLSLRAHFIPTIISLSCL